MTTRQKQESIAQKVLTLYGERGSIPEDVTHAGGFPRGIAMFNGHVHDLQRAHPDVIIHSVSHNSMVYFDPEGKQHHSMVWMLCTIVYSGTIRPEYIEAIAIPSGHNRTPRDLEEGDCAYSTVVRIQL